jgi:hypothetical protein
MVDQFKDAGVGLAAAIANGPDRDRFDVWARTSVSSAGGKIPNGGFL